VAEHFLDVAQVGSGAQHLGGQRVAEDVGSDPFFDPGFARVARAPRQNYLPPMNPFPDTLILPTTANRLRVTEKNEAFIQKLLEAEVDAATFLMPEAEMPASNDAKIAHDDLISQIKKLPAEIRDKIFPPPTPLPDVIHTLPTTVTATDDNDDDSGMGGMSMGMSMSPGLERQLERQRQQQRRQSEGPGMSM